ncbi:MAG: mevalonate kinase [Candidatus Helarchaeota archaeon]
MLAITLKEITASAPGKIILFGEHAVVYGSAAIAMAINLRSFVTAKFISEKQLSIHAKDVHLSQEFPLDLEAIESKIPHLKIMGPILNCCTSIFKKKFPENGIELKIWSQIPLGAGLGSSAAIAVSTVGALNGLLELNLSIEEISSLAFESECLVHGTPSGIDNTISSHGGAVYYKKGSVKRMDVRSKIPILILDTKIKRKTSFWVGKVKEKYNANRQVFSLIFQSVDKISLKGRKLLERGYLKDLGELMNVNQGLLDAMGVATPEVSKIINKIRKQNVFGVKITGAGGGGCIIILCDPRRIKDISRQLRKDHDIFSTSLSRDGLKIEKMVR